MVTRILVDTNVLFSRTLRDWLLILQVESEAAIFTTCWTADIAAEVLSKLRKAFPHVDGGVMAGLRRTIMIDDLRPDLVESVAVVQEVYLRRSNRDVDLAQRLDASGCPRFAARVRSALSTPSDRPGEPAPAST